MDETRGQQSIPSGPPVYPPGHQVPPTYYGAPPPLPARKPGVATVLVRTIRLLLRRLLYGLIIAGRVLRPFAIPLIIFVVLGSIIGWMGFQLWGPKPDAPADTRAAAIPPAPAVEDFLKGQQSYDADMMWSAYSTAYQAAQLERGASKETLQAQADNLRLRGLKYVKYDYVGGVNLDGNGGMYFYAVELDLQGQRAKLPMILTVGNDGRIVRILWPLNNES